MNGKSVFLLIMLSVLLMGADGAGPGQDEQDALRKQQSALRTHIEALRKEQDFLLFQKAMYRTDSKYLVINIRNRTGQLRYKNRLLKEFKFRLSKVFRSGSIRSGAVVLTKKVESKKDRGSLLFGGALLMHRKGAALPPKTPDVAVMSLNRKDLTSIFSALEQGTMAYLK
jgi:hypothetical protein